MDREIIVSEKLRDARKFLDVCLCLIIAPKLMIDKKNRYDIRIVPYHVNNKEEETNSYEQMLQPFLL